MYYCAYFCKIHWFKTKLIPDKLKDTVYFYECEYFKKKIKKNKKREREYFGLENGRGTERSEEHIRISVQTKVPNEEEEKRSIGSFLPSYTGSRRFTVRQFWGDFFVCFSFVLRKEKLVY